MRRLRAPIEELGATTLLVTALDEVAWLLNPRGSDVPLTYRLSRLKTNRGATRLSHLS